MVLDKLSLTEALIEAGLRPEAARRAVDILERDQSELARQAEVDRRFTELNENNRIRFEALDKRIDDLKTTLDRQFDAIQKQFDAIQKQFDAVNQRFGTVQKQFDAVNQRFDAIQKQFDAVNQRFDTVQKQFDAVNQRIDDLKDSVNQRFTVMYWVMGSGFGITFALLAVILARLF